MWLKFFYAVPTLWAMSYVGHEGWAGGLASKPSKTLTLKRGEDRDMAV